MTANRPFDDDDLPGRGFVERRADPNRADREISLGTATILGIFFGLALVCAGFFGFGYAMGHRSSQSAPTAVDPTSGVSVGAPKPAAGSLATHSAVPAPQSTASPATTETAPAQTATVSLVPPAAPKSAVTPGDRIIAGDKPPAATPTPAPANLQPATSFMVQVAAVHTQEVADIEVAALKKQGYTVVIRHEPQDNLLHVQIGPFTDRKEAEAMRARVLADGFNAIVK